MASYGSVPGKGIIRAGIEKPSRRVPERCRICVSTEKWHHTGHYREKVESVRVSKNRPGDSEKRSNLCEYRKMAESGSVRGKSRIRASVEKLSRGVLEKGRNFLVPKNGIIRVSSGKR